MRPMTASEAWQIERDPYAAPDDWKQARLILSALVELREAVKVPQLQPMIDAENKLAALERGEEPPAPERATKYHEPEEFDPACAVCSRPTHRNAEMCINCEMDNEVQRDLDGLMGG